MDQQKNQDKDLPPIQVPANEQSLVRKLEISQLREKIEHALDRIPGPFREVFIWRHINELSYEEIAEIKGLPTGTVKNRVFQAKEMIRNLLEEKP
jgi:RNA polymerase sigma-70 factor (ECF subfamily)